MNLFDSLNSREQASLIWITVFIIGMLSIKNIRLSAAKLIRTFFKSKLLLPIGLITGYAATCVGILYWLGLWNTSLLKDTIVWYLAVPFLTFFRTNKIAEDKWYFCKTIKDLLAFSAIGEFLINTYTLSLWIELIIVFIAILIALLLAAAGKQEKYLSVRKLLTGTLALIGTGLIIYTIVQLVNHMGGFASWQTLNTFLLSPLLTLLYLPCIYLLLVYMQYATTFTLLPFAINDKQLLKNAKIKALLQFGLNWRALKRWQTNLSRLPVPQTKAELEHTFQHYRQLKKLETQKPAVPKNDGWSPYQAKDFLIEQGITTGHYDKAYEETYFAISPAIKLSDGLHFYDTATYSLEGTMEKATSLLLSFKLWEPFTTDQLKPVLKYTTSLFQKVLNEPPPSAITEAIREKCSTQINKDPYGLFVRVIDFEGNRKGYDLEISIRLMRGGEVEPNKVT